MSFKINGFEELEKKLKEMQSGVDELKQNSNVPLDQLLNAQFMRKYTKHENIDDFFETGGFSVENNEEFEAIPDEELDAYVCEATKFSSWEKMLDKATEEYVEKKMGF